MCDSGSRRHVVAKPVEGLSEQALEAGSGVDVLVFDPFEDDELSWFACLGKVALALVDGDEEVRVDVDPERCARRDEVRVIFGFELDDVEHRRPAREEHHAAAGGQELAEQLLERRELARRAGEPLAELLAHP